MPPFSRIRNGRYKMLKRLLDLASDWADDVHELHDVINEPDETGMTPLHIAALKNRRRCVQVLIENRAECVR